MIIKLTSNKVVQESLKESVNSDIVSMIKKQFPKATIKTSVRKHSDVHKSNPDTPIGKTKYVNIRITPDSESTVNSILQYCNHNIKKVLDSDNRFYYYGDVPARNPRGGKEVILSYDDYSDLSDDEYNSLLGESLKEDIHKQIRLSSIPGVTRDPSNDFTDDGHRFQAYLYKGIVPITYLRYKEDVYITIAFHHLDDVNYQEYKEFPSYKHAHEFNGVPVDTFNAEIFQKNLEDAYKDIVDFLAEPHEEGSAFKVADKKYESKLKESRSDTESSTDADSRVHKSPSLGTECTVKSVNSYCQSLGIDRKDLKSITIPNSVTKIDDSAFEDCTSLTSINIPDGVKEIGEDAFKGCTSLRSIVIPEGVKELRWSTFYECTSLESITIPNSVTKIGSWVFEGCTSLKSITIPNSVKEIWGRGVFAYCTSLTSVNIPDSVTDIGEETFKECTSLKSITIPNSVTKLDWWVFDGCTSLTNITIPNSVTEIGSRAFRGCTSLKSITIPDGVTEIEEETFERCTSLKSIVIPNSVTKIESRAFRDCTSLTSITIPDSVTYIGYGVFLGCSNLTVIKCHKDSIAHEYAMMIHVPVNLIESLSESQSSSDTKDYRVVTVGMDIAMPADKRLEDYGPIGQGNNGKLFKALASALESVGLEMAGDYVDALGDVTDVYKDNDYEFFE